jgi:4a-hydroxytetrahydrobiopterin dehydratase
MATVVPLTQNELSAALRELPGWAVVNGKLHGEFRFNDFVTAFAFMTKVAFAAEAVAHHPEWFNVYDRVVIDLVTHDAGNAISQKDIDLAHLVSKLAAV